MIILTGGAGFIGSNLLKFLNDKGISEILVVDSLGKGGKWKNLVGKRFVDYMHKTRFRQLLAAGCLPKADSVFHLGACSDTTETDAEYLMDNNYLFSRELLHWALEHNAAFLYASSAATYGDGSYGYADDDETTLKLRPLNMYGYSKQLLDEYILNKGLTSRVTGLKFFNVFGPNEYHKGNMRSMINKAFYQIRDKGGLSLFKSNDPLIADGEQKRDFIYVKDAVEALWWLFENQHHGIFNVGSGQARSWLDLARSIFRALQSKEQIEFIEMPTELAGKYQNYTQADLSKLTGLGFPLEFYSLEEAVRDYIVNYLNSDNEYL